MHHQRRRAIPVAHEAQEVGEVLLGRSPIAVERLGDVVHVEQQVPLGGDGIRPPHHVDVLHQGDDVACAVSMTVRCRRVSEQTWIMVSGFRA